MITKEAIVRWIRRFAALIAENKVFLTELDAAIGDADHGVNMDRGFTEVVAKLPGWESQDISGVLKGVGMALLSKVGGASGPLYGTLFMRFSMAVAGKTELTDADFLLGLSEGVKGIQQRGSALPGEKTMVDALLPAVQALREALEQGADGCAALSRAAAAAEAGATATIAMQAMKGRASYLGVRSIGHQDPGAVSAYLLLKAATEAVC
jgi:phosphoenolpyruvate---glycerone phosphotransferase subunit DhaL